jgi:hypothetical protein
MKTILFLALLPMASLAQSMPVPRVGNSCPLGFYASSGYCMPSSSNKNQWAVIKEKQQSCPLGSYASGSYCVKSYAR